MTIIRAATATALLGALALPSVTQAANVVLVHGMAMDGSNWRAVHDLLVDDGHQVSVAQLPLTRLADDVAAVRRVLDRQEGPVILVGHSYGGAVITAAGNDPDVAALVYVAALQPDAGESVGELNASMSSPFDPAAMLATEDGFVIVDPTRFREFIAADVPEAEAAFLADAQAPTALRVFTDEAPDAAWHDKPSFAVVATQDRSVSPDLQRWMYERSKATVTELEASHMVHMSQARAVADVIEDATRTTN